ncbi:hypothetical protein Taro_021216 [Colocasia esculenta]|uniref:PPIase cyclophilin-type domain-containing protein n=1 Tax=Colocasia esculenta TaxID=4460 RepID=A0A843UYB6_COLES|nr:hypothetical protein [Colocasia esculenta]
MNHVFRVDKGFVAQVADVVGGRSAPMNEEQRTEAEKTVVGEFSNVKHVRGVLSMGRDRNASHKAKGKGLLPVNLIRHSTGEKQIFLVWISP